MSARHRCDVFAVAGRVGVKLLRTEQRSTLRRPRECFARAALRRIGQAHGEAHLELVLRLIVETADNATALEGDVIAAVSKVVLSGLVNVDGSLFEAFDAIDLPMLRTWARGACKGTTATDAMASVLMWQLANPEKIMRQAA